MQTKPIWPLVVLALVAIQPAPALANCEHVFDAIREFLTLDITTRTKVIESFRTTGQAILPQGLVFSNDAAIAQEIEDAVRARYPNGTNAQLHIKNSLVSSTTPHFIEISRESTLALERAVLATWGMLIVAEPEEYSRSRLRSFAAAQNFCAACNADGSLLHIDNEGTYTHILRTLRGDPTILYKGNPMEYKQGVGGKWWYAVGRDGQRITIEARRGSEVLDEETHLVEQENQNIPGETLVFSGADRRNVVTPNLHSSPVVRRPERVTFFFGIEGALTEWWNESD